MFCAKCGVKIPDESVFCAKCGTAVESAQPTNAEEQPVVSSADVQNGKMKKSIYIAAGIAVVGIVAAIIFVMSGNALVGSWMGDGNIEFFRNGSGVWDEQDISWRQRGDTIEVIFYHERVWDEYFVERVGNGYQLNLREHRPGGGWGGMSYRRDNAPVFTDGTYIIGRWDSSSWGFIQFSSNGTGIWSGQIAGDRTPTRWSIEDGVITKTWQHEEVYQFSLSDNTLTLFRGGRSGTFTRLGRN